MSGKSDAESDAATIRTTPQGVARKFVPPGKHWIPSVSPSRVVGDEGLETGDATFSSDNTLCQLAISTDAESDAFPSDDAPAGDRFAASLLMIAGLPLSDADKAEAVKWLLREAGR